jgi:SSS family solute:Na+ symporter
MTSLNGIDTSIIAIYLLLTFGVGVWMTKRASQSMEHYYLGGRSLPWYMLGMAGMANWFDLTGTMIITSFLYMLGPKGLFIEFRGGAVLILAFLICYTGKWHRRSGCMTGAEWISYRFGQGKEAKWMRIFKAVMTVVATIGMLAYLIRGTSLFVGMFIPYSPILVTAVIVAFCTVYTMMAGFYGVVLTDLVQGAIVLVSCIIVSIIAFHLVPDNTSLGQLAESVTGNSTWISSMPKWHTEMPIGYEMYETLILFAGFYLLRNVLGGLGTGDESRYFAAKSDRDCALQSMLQGVTVAFRWPMMMGFAILGLFLVNSLFPDMSKTKEAAAIIKNYNQEIQPAFWHELTTNIINAPETYSPAMIDAIEQSLGEDWPKRLPVVSYNGTINPEQILPAVLLNSIPTGLRGFLIVAMLAAMMSTLTSEVNKTSAQVVRDIYQNALRPAAKNRELMIIAYTSTAAIVIASFWMGISAKSINSLWGWIIMSLTAGGLAPYVLRLYWWRCNAWGQIGGTLLGGVGAVTQRIFAPEMSELTQFALMSSLSFAGTIGLSYLTKPTPLGVLRNFYRTTRPFGLWGPLKAEIDGKIMKKWEYEHRVDIISVPFVMTAQVTLFLMPMQLVIKSYGAFFMTLPIFLAAAFGTYWFWWRNLPPKDNPGTDRAHGQAEIDSVTNQAG